MDDTLGYRDIQGARGSAELLGYYRGIASCDGITETSDSGLERGTNSFVPLLSLRVGLDPLDLRLDVCHLLVNPLPTVVGGNRWKPERWRAPSGLFCGPEGISRAAARSN